MADGSSQDAVAEVKAIRDACISKETRKKYTSNINGIKKWIREVYALTLEDRNTAKFFDADDDLNLTEFTPACFEQFLVYKRSTVKSATLSGYRSAIKDLYRLKRAALPVEYGDDMKQFFSRCKRLEAEQNQSSSPKHSGKQPLTFTLYKELCWSTLERNDGGFSHLFLTTQWNLMCRSVYVQTLQTQHFLAKDDAVGAIFFKSKTNQEGAGPRDPRHLFANPFSPSTCWVTALAIYWACNPRTQPGPLFLGSDPKLRFGKTLGNLLKKDGVAKTYGTHSVRKGVATFACGGSTGGPSIVSVCLRCGWSMGGVQDRYFRYEAAGDQFLGRVVAGLPVNDSKFAILPPHFRNNSDDEIKSCLAAMFPGLVDELPLSDILRLCLASLVQHADFLVNHLPTNHPLLSTFVFTNPTVLNNLRSKLEVGESRWMEPSGIPPHIELYKKLDKQQQSIDALPEMLEQRMEKVLEEKDVAAGNITRKRLRQEIKALLLEVGLRRTSSTEPTPASSGPTHTYYSWGGKFHRLPKEFEFPSIDPLGAWILWWFGDARRGYPPYKAISSDDLDTPKKKATLAEWSIMMRHISNAVEAQAGMSLPPIRDEPHAIELFNIGYHKLQLKPSKRKRRTNQLKLTTVLRLIREAEGTGTRSLPFKRRKRQVAVENSPAHGPLELSAVTLQSAAPSATSTPPATSTPAAATPSSPTQASDVAPPPALTPAASATPAATATPAASTTPAATATPASTSSRRGATAPQAIATPPATARSLVAATLSASLPATATFTLTGLHEVGSTPSHDKTRVRDELVHNTQRANSLHTSNTYEDTEALFGFPAYCFAL